MLIGNYSVLSKDPGRSIGGGAIGLGMNRADYNKTSMARAAFAGEAWEPKSGVPDGYRAPYAWVMPLTAGGLSARNALLGTGDIEDLNLAGGVNGEATLTGAGDITGAGALIVSLVAALTGSGTISSAEAIAYLNLAAELAGAGDLAGAATALAHASVALEGAGEAAGTATALGTLAASIVVTGDALSTANIGAAVWAQVIESGFTAEQILRIIAAFAAGDGTDLEGGNPAFTGLDGATTRIEGAYAAGTRTITNLDGA